MAFMQNTYSCLVLDLEASTIARIDTDIILKGPVTVSGCGWTFQSQQTSKLVEAILEQNQELSKSPGSEFCKGFLKGPSAI